MAHGTIKTRLRPIKFAFLVHPSDKDGLLQAIEINTFLWGGMYNPLIPTSKRTPREFQNLGSRNLSSKRIIAGYLDAYDPDYVVPVGNCRDHNYDVGDRQIIDCSEILSRVSEDGTPRHGIGLFEVLGHFIEKELKFIRQEPLTICFFDFHKSYRLFLASVFGSLSENIREILEAKFQHRLGAKRSSCSIFNYCDFLSKDTFFLRRLSSLYVRPFRRRVASLFFLDVSNPIDIIDYWNLRAIGWDVVPVATQASDTDKMRKFCSAFVERNFYPDRINPRIYHNTTLVKSRSVTAEQIHSFARSLDIRPSPEGTYPKLLRQHWYPRIWDEWARDADGVRCCELESRTAEHEVTDYEGRMTLRTLDPEFSTGLSLYREARFANEVELHLYGEDELLAEVFPEGDETLVTAIGGAGFREWRLSKKGIVYLSHYPNWSIRLSLPRAEDVVKEWLKSKGWEVKLSVPGRVAKEMIRQLGGTWGISTLANEGIVHLLEKMADGRSINEISFRGEISKIVQQQRYMKDTSKMLRRLVDVQMFRLGLTVQCPTCTQRTCYSLKDLDYQLQCPSCLSRFRIPAHSPKEMQWSYRTFGPFALPRRAYGVYSVLLTLRFFSRLLHGSTTPIMSFTASKTAKKLEADIGLFFRVPMFGPGKVELFFAECKTYNHFSKKDTNRMAILGRRFPGAFLVFATLRKAVTNQEKGLLRRLADRERKDWQAGRPFNPILVLTGTELFSEWGPPQCWEDAGQKARAFAQRSTVLRDLIELCDVTQQLYLDMKPRDELILEHLERLREHK